MAVHRLTAVVTGHEVSRNEAPKRLTTKQAVKALGVSSKTLARYAARGLCQQIRPSGKRGPNSRVYYLPDEIAALVQGEGAARELMAKKRSPRTRSQRMAHAR